MTRRDSDHAKSVRVNRIERLETRHMLSADGLSFADFHHDFADELARTSRSSQAWNGSEIDLRGSEGNRIGQRRGDLTLRLHRDGLGDDGRERVDQHFGREVRDPLTIPPVAGPPVVDMPMVEVELVVNSNLTFRSVPLERIESITIQPITSSRITFIIFVPSVSSRLSLDSIASRSATDTIVGSRAIPLTAAADSSAAKSPIAESRLPRDPVQELTPAEQAAIEQAEAVQLVSVRQHNDFIAAATAIDAVPEIIQANSGTPSRLDFAFDSLRFDDSPLDPLQGQSKALEDNFAELDELLDAIALERAKSTHQRDNTVRPNTSAENHTDAIVESHSETVSDGMILLLPGTSLSNPTAQFAAQVFDRLDDSAISQWTVGVGFYRALEVVGDTQFANALIASEMAIDPINSAAAQNGVADSFAWQSDSVSSSRQAAGVVFCCLGIQYLRNRRKETDELAMPSAPRDEARLD